MSVHPTPLALQVASIREAILTQESHAWIPAVVHALIIACLARIFGRLEDMIRLWHAGQLPLPLARTLRHAAPTPGFRRWSTVSGRRATPLPVMPSPDSTAPTAAAIALRCVPAAPVLTSAAQRASPSPLHAVRRSARAPPSDRPAHFLKNLRLRGRLAVSFSLHIRNNQAKSAPLKANSPAATSKPPFYVNPSAAANGPDTPGTPAPRRSASSPGTAPPRSRTQSSPPGRSGARC